MCGIFFIVQGLVSNWEDAKFSTEILNFYKANYFLQKHQSGAEKPITLIKHIKDHKLFLKIDFDHVMKALKERGPDCQRGIMLDMLKRETHSFSSIEAKKNFALFENSKGAQSFCFSSVLHMRGANEVPFPQPLSGKATQNVLMFNGEIYSVKKEKLVMLKSLVSEECLSKISMFNPELNDGIQLLEILDSFSLFYRKEFGDKEKSQYDDLVALIFTVFEGDFALVFHDIENKRLLVGKDPIGKRSLLFGITESGAIVFSSVSPNPTGKVFEERKEEEEECIGARVPMEDYLMEKYSRDFKDAQKGQTVFEMPGNYIQVLHYDLKTLSISGRSIDPFFESLAFNPLAASNQLPIKQELESAVGLFKEVFIDYLKQLIVTNPRSEIKETKGIQPTTESLTHSKYLVLFSGGVDSTLIARMLSKVIPTSESYSSHSF